MAGRRWCSSPTTLPKGPKSCSFLDGRVRRTPLTPKLAQGLLQGRASPRPQLRCCDSCWHGASPEEDSRSWQPSMSHLMPGRHH